MIKRIIQISSLLVLSVVFFSAPVSAQSINRMEAKIPFDFNVGEKTYVAGDYVMKLSKVSNSTVALSIEDKFGTLLENVVLSNRGDAADGQARLVFDHENGERYLAKVLTSDKGFSLALPQQSKEKKVREVVALR